MGRSSERLSLKGVPELLRQRSLVDGLWNGRKRWMAVGAVVWGFRGVRWALHRDERVLLREVLEPGETVIVREIPKKPRKAKPQPKVKPLKGRRKRKAAKAAAKRASLDARKQAKTDAKAARKAKTTRVNGGNGPSKVSRREAKARKRVSKQKA